MQIDTQPVPVRGCFWKSLLQVILALIAIQAGHAGMNILLWSVFHPKTETAWTLISLVDFLSTGLILMAYIQPEPQSLGLSWSQSSSWEKALYIAAGLLFLTLVWLSLSFGTQVFLQNITAALVIPFFEETIFRGWAWNKLENSLAGRPANLLTYASVSVLFSIWHLGYMDTYLLKMLPQNPGLEWGHFLLMKLATTLFIGLIIGMARWQTKKLYAPLLLHGLINLFGR